ncbi:hypothetical protein Bca101_018447 [Brassica carinata]
MITRVDNQKLDHIRPSTKMDKISEAVDSTNVLGSLALTLFQFHVANNVCFVCN